MDMLLEIFNSASFEIILKLSLACLLGGLIGFQRESIQKPAGLKTHMLVCLGAALVVVTSDYIFNSYPSTAGIDPSRLGAQVISGIGFLGAGTILRDGVSIRGLTTAASLWTVACIGLAAGAGFYWGAVSASILVFLILTFSRGFEAKFREKRNLKHITLLIDSSCTPVGDIEKVLGESQVSIQSIRFKPAKEEGYVFLSLLLKYADMSQSPKVIEKLYGIDGIVEIYEK